MLLYTIHLDLKTTRPLDDFIDMVGINLTEKDIIYYT